MNRYILKDYFKIRPWFVISRVVMVLSTILLIFWNIYLILVMVNKPNFNDFGKFYYSTLAFLNERNIYDISPASIIPVSALEFGKFLNLNPPHFHIFFLPFAFFSPNTAFFLWETVSFFCLIVSFIIIFKEIGISMNPFRVWVIILGVMAFAGTGTIIITGQLSFIILLFVTLFWIEARHDRWTRAGVFLGIGLSIKIFLVIFLPYLILRKKFFSALMATMVAGLFFVLGILILEGKTYQLWLEALKSIDWHWASMNASINGLLARVFDSSPYFIPLLKKPGIVRPIWFFSAGIVGIITLAISILDTSNEMVDRSFALLFIGAQLISPLGWLYYHWFCIGPVIALIAFWHKKHDENYFFKNGLFGVRNIFLIFSFLGFLVPFNSLAYFQPSLLATITLGSTYFWATLALWLALCIDWLPLVKQLLRPKSRIATFMER